MNSLPAVESRFLPDRLIDINGNTFTMTKGSPGHLVLKRIFDASLLKKLSSNSDDEISLSLEEIMDLCPELLGKDRVHALNLIRHLEKIDLLISSCEYNEVDFRIDYWFIISFYGRQALAKFFQGETIVNFEM